MPVPNPRAGHAHWRNAICSWGDTWNTQSDLRCLNWGLVAESSLHHSIKSPQKVELFSAYMAPASKYKQSASYFMGLVWFYLGIVFFSFYIKKTNPKPTELVISIAPLLKGCTSAIESRIVTIPSPSCWAETVYKHTVNIFKTCPRARKGFWVETGKDCCPVAKFSEAV